ncbi:MAG: hypothetical protein EBS00_05125, partial [Verrucomicrobia bacterium]|nr:hypothetical protein [Verrucomicrobiota bacterium]
MKEASSAANPSPSSSLAQPLTLGATIAALGVVYGDIGTSPLYAFRECIRYGMHAGASPISEEAKNVSHRKPRSGFILLGVFGTALLFGDGVITPAISVLSALEGIKEVGAHATNPADLNLFLRTLSDPKFTHYFIPTAAVAILFGIFYLQKRGSGKVGMYFTFNPLTAISFFLEHPGLGMIILGAVFLAVTGA